MVRLLVMPATTSLSHSSSRYDICKCIFGQQQRATSGSTSGAVAVADIRKQPGHTFGIHVSRGRLDASLAANHVSDLSLDLGMRLRLGKLHSIDGRSRDHSSNLRFDLTSLDQ
jgi:hypothetical protein